MEDVICKEMRHSSGEETEEIKKILRQLRELEENKLSLLANQNERLRNVLTSNNIMLDDYSSHPYSANRKLRTPQLNESSSSTTKCKENAI